MDKNKLYEVVERMVDPECGAFTHETLLDALCRALNEDELEENLRYIDRMHDTGVFAAIAAEDEEPEEDDYSEE